MQVNLSLCQFITRQKYFLVLNDTYIRVSKKKFKEIAKVLGIKLINPKDKTNKILDHYNIKITECDEDDEEEN